MSVIRYFSKVITDDEGREWVPASEAEAMIPDPSQCAWVDGETKAMLAGFLENQSNGIVLIWGGLVENAVSISTCTDANEIARALEHAAKSYRDPAFIERRRPVSLEPTDLRPGPDPDPS